MVAKWGGRLGSISEARKAKMWQELGADKLAENADVFAPVRTSRSQVEDALRNTGMPELLKTRYAWGI